MKAYNLHGIDNLQYEEAAKPTLKEGWVLVKVKAAGVCSSDIPRIFTKGTYHFPTIPGHEFAGIVEEVYSDSDKTWLGKRVGIFPLIPCQQCPQCKQGKYETCINYDYLGSRRDGGYAQYVAVPTWNLIELDDSISFVAAATLEPYAVANHAVKRAGIQESDTVAIIGSGMIGFAAAQWAKSKGAQKVYVIGRSPSKQEIADKISGIEYIYDYDPEEIRCDKVIEAVGSAYSIALAIHITATGGTTVLMGNPASDILLEQSVYWQILRKQLTLVGTWNSSYESNQMSDWTEVLDAMKEKKINPELLITDCFGQTGLMEALEMMKNHSKVYCKVMTLWNDDKE